MQCSAHLHKRGSEACGRAKTAGATASTRTAADTEATAYTSAAAHTGTTAAARLENWD